MKHRPRWKHRCPACGRSIFWEKVYCKICIAKEPSRGRFCLAHHTTSYRKIIMTGTKPTINHLFALIHAHTVCVECGHKMHLNDLKHRCYSVLDTTVRTKNLLRCWTCHDVKPKTLFPTISRNNRLLRSRICSTCLHDANMIVVHKIHHLEEPRA